MSSYRDRVDAGRTLAGQLLHLAAADPLVLGIPRGGVVVAAEIAAALGGTVGAVVAAKVRAPGNDELAIGAVAPGGVALVDEVMAHRLGIDAAAVEAALGAATAEVARREEVFGALPEVTGRTVVVVDDGVATGATLRAALAAVRLGAPLRLVCAVPVGPPATIDLLAHEVDEIVCPVQPDRLWAVGEWYQDFTQVDDATVVRLLG